MLPELAHGDFVIVSNIYKSLKVGDLIVAEHPEYKSIIKRIVKTCSEHGVLLSGNNSSSISSDAMGWISTQKIFGKVLFEFKGKR